MNCATCFYQFQKFNEDPCNDCIDFDKWVSVDFLEKINNKSMSENQQNQSATFTVGVKYDTDKPQWSLVPLAAMTEVVDVLTYGAKKYAPDNWKKVPDARRRYIDACFRHFVAYASGEKNDPETGKSHLAHAMCCMLFLLAFDKGEHGG